MPVHDSILKHMLEMAARFADQGITLVMPPPSTLTLGTYYTDVDEGKMLAARIPFDRRFTNPIGTFQGGLLCGALDDVYGPLTYMAARAPVVTIEMSTSFLRPFLESDEWVEIRAEVISKSKSLLVLKAEARSKHGKLIATSTSHSLLVAAHHLETRA